MKWKAGMDSQLSPPIGQLVGAVWAHPCGRSGKIRYVLKTVSITQMDGMRRESMERAPHPQFIAMYREPWSDRPRIFLHPPPCEKGYLEINYFPPMVIG